MLFIYLIQTFCFISINAYIVEPGPIVKATKGEVWPKPQQQHSQNEFTIVRPSLLKFEVTNQNCQILDEAIKRYTKIVSSSIYSQRHRSLHRFENQPRLVENPNGKWSTDPLFGGFLDAISINLKQPCEEKPHPDMKEAYELNIKNATALLESDSIWGILWGLETFSQLLTVTDDRLSLRVNTTKIIDAPRFSFRGLLLDTSRHFINVFTIKQVLDGMVYNKLNVFHWHIVDDHSFPYESKIFPELSEQGAFKKDLVYSQNDIQSVIEYARLRGIRVVAEFDTPGHTRSWGISHPEILTSCGGEYEGKLGPINPIVNETYDFMRKLLKEVGEVFPDQYIHLGGDEVGFECWESNPNITQYLKENNITRYEKLEEIYIQQIVDIVDDLKHKSIVWQEVFENGVHLVPGTVVHVWTGDSKQLLSDITRKGLPALLSSCWYLDHLSTGGDWIKYYNCDPQDFPGTEEQRQLVLGGLACMWAESVDNSNVLQRIFPRVSAAAEKLWSPAKFHDVKDAERRLEEHTCRMKARGLPAQPPNGPGFCP